MVLASEDVLKSSLTANLRGPHARNVLAQGVDPCEMKAALGKNAFFLRMREWEVAQIRDSSFNTLPDEHQTGRIAATSN